MARKPSLPTDLAFAPGGVFRAALDAVIVMDIEGYVRDFNPAAERTFGYLREEVVGQELAGLIIPPAVRAAHRNAVRRIRETGQSRSLDRRLELTALHRDGSEFAVELSITRIPDSEPPLFAGFIRPMLDADAAELARRQAQQRALFLAGAGLVLDRSLEVEETLRRLAELTVPELAALAVIDLVGEGVLRGAVAASDPPERAQELEAMRAAHPLNLRSAHPVISVLSGGEPLLLAAMDEDYLRTIAQGVEHFELMRRLRYRSAIIVPLAVRGHKLGALSLLRLEGQRAFNREDLRLAEELALRAAFAVDNARLFETTRRLARTLQESLLPRSMPEIPGVRISPRYGAALEGQEVGGDFYDAFIVGEGRFAVSIGDVCGKGAEAAALTALARHTIRAVAGAGASPSTVMRLLAEAVLRETQSLAPRFLTALVALAEFDGETVNLELSAAGHPPPLLRRADGTVEAVAVGGPLVGIESPASYEEARVVLRPGDTMVLYTDGLTDARAPVVTLTESDLADLLAGAPARSGAALAEYLEAQVTQGEHPRDDIAILIIDVEGQGSSNHGASLSTTQPLGASR